MITDDNNNGIKGTSFLVDGMTCASCVRIVEKSLSRIKGIQYVSVNLATGRGYVLADESITFSEIRQAVEKSGYHAFEKVESNVILENYIRTRRSLMLSMAVTLPLMVLMVLHMTGIHIPGFLYMESVSGAMVIFITARRTLKGAWIALSHFHTNMDTLISIGALSAWSTAILAVLKFPVVSFGSLAPMLITLHITGRFIESRLKERASRDISALLEIQPDRALVLTGKGPVETDIESIKPGETILARSGDRIALDGTVLSGEGYVDESMVTGEALPSRVKPGDTVTGGTILASGSLEIRVDHVGTESFLNRMAQLVEEAQSSRVPIQAMADRITRFFIPGVFSLAIASSAAWYFFYREMVPFLSWCARYLPWVNTDTGPVSMAVFVFIATLVIACPCALGLATPMALVTGSGIMARRGLILRAGEAIQTAGEIDIILLDKTGTITEGRPVVTSTTLDNETLSIAASMETRSSHPLARAVISYAEKLSVPVNLTFENINEIPGEGIEGYYLGTKYFTGRPDGKTVLPESGDTIIEVRNETGHIGTITISDPVKTTARESIARLNAMGISTVMVTGDREATARHVAQLCGIDTVEAGVLPEGKVNVVRRYQMSGMKTAMAGDGINDAAALGSADLSVAMGTGADIAMNNADIIAVHGDLSSIIEAITISRMTFARIRRNLFQAFAYNIIAIPLAMAGLLHPLIAETAMLASSISVIAGSLSLRRINKKKED